MRSSYLLFAIALFFGSIALKVAFTDARAFRANDAQVAAHELIAFSGFVRNYLQAGNVLPEGVVAGTSIPTPAWFKQAQDFMACTESGESFVYLSVADQGEASRILLAAESTTSHWDAMRIGRSLGGQLLTVRSTGEPPITLPAAIPANAVVIAL